MALGGGHVWVGGKAYENNWVEPGKAYRLVTCAVCLDTGREFTDDGPLGDICACTFGSEWNTWAELADDMRREQAS